MARPTDKIVILGAGVFGLSTALHLAKRGYTDITVLDKQPYDKNHYHPDDGCDGASADINKVFRTTYGDRKEYQDLAMECLPHWREWTSTIFSTATSYLPQGLEQGDEILSESGFMRVAEGKEFTPFQAANLAGIEADGRRDRVFLVGDEGERLRAEKVDEAKPGFHWANKLGRFSGIREGNIHGFLDMDAGFTRADKACVWALHLCKQAGVKFVLDTTAGQFDTFIFEDEDKSTGIANGHTDTGKQVIAVKTKDGVRHPADKVIVACGGWTASVVPEVSGLLETTGGSVAYIDLPKDRPDLWERFGPEEFCVWSFEAASGTGGGGFPRTPEGRLKFGYRATKYTNFASHSSGARISVPITRYTPEPILNIPLEALNEIKEIVRTVYPELVDIGITGTRMCWYTDSIDNHFVADYVPGYNETLFVASGGSGHGFKFLPLLGRHFANQLEHITDIFTPVWKWRSAAVDGPANGLEEGEGGPRVLGKVKMATEADWKFDRSTLVA